MALCSIFVRGDQIVLPF